MVSPELMLVSPELMFRELNQRLLIASSVPLIPRSPFLHFTLNHYSFPQEI
jgi:hypothetical protein